jgi:hypothetical protein
VRVVFFFLAVGQPHRAGLAPILRRPRRRFRILACTLLNSSSAVKSTTYPSRSCLGGCTAADRAVVVFSGDCPCRRGRSMLRGSSPSIPRSAFALSRNPSVKILIPRLPNPRPSDHTRLKGITNMGIRNNLYTNNKKKTRLCNFRS